MNLFRNNRTRIAWRLALAALSFIFVSDRLSAQESSKLLRDVQRQYTKSIRPMLETHCADCHWGDNADADLNLEKYQTIDQLLNDRKKWRKILTRVAAKEMPPPEDCDAIPDADHQQLMDWIKQLLNSVDCTNINPGQVTIRRLNRTEYENTIRDLTGVDFRADGNFPVDDVGYGFDNIADVLSLSPILMEKYLEAAEKITLEAVKDPARSRETKTIDAKAFAADTKASINDRALAFYFNASASAKVKVPTKGTYQVTILASGDQAGDDAAKLGIDLNGQQRQFFDVTNSRDEGDNQLTGTLRFNRAGSHRIRVAFTNDYFQETRRNEARIDRNLYLTSVTLSGPLEAQPGQYGKLVLGDPGTKKSQQRTSAEKSVRIFASRGYRRPAKSDEVRRLMQLYDAAIQSGDPFEAALRYPLQAVLVSPHFLYRFQQPVPAGEVRQLDDYELATSLSYFIWSSMPDAELFSLAAKGKLKQDAVLRQQVKRMLADKRARALVQNFTAQWLQLRSLSRLQPDADLFPGVDGQLKTDMATETKLLVYDLIRRDAPINDLLDADYTYLNERLAKHYGVPGVSGANFQKVAAKRTKREGILTHASILTLTSNPNRTSPVKRGKWIMENLLGEEPPPPDPDAMQLEDQAELTGTMRQRMEQHRADPSCAVCHKVMDELGFALENYDAVGRWRTRDNAGEIDARGELPDGTKFSGSRELQTMIGTEMEQQFVRCVSEKMLVYALGRGLEYYDECSLDKIVDHLEFHDDRISELVIAICQSDPFRKRLGEGASPIQNSENSEDSN